MGSFDQYALWQQLAVAALLFGFLTLTLWWLLRRWNRIEQPVLDPTQPADNGAPTRSDAYAPMFRRIAPPSQPVPVAVTPETPRPSLTATTSPTAPVAPVPTRSVPFTEPDLEESVHSAPVTPSLGPAPVPAPFRPGTAPVMAANPQRVVKILPRTGASIGDISAKPVTASIGTRLSVLSLSVVDRPYAKPILKPSEPTAVIAHVAKGSEPDTVRAATPLRVFSREEGIQNAGVAASRLEKPRSPLFREMSSGALTSRDKDAAGPAGARPATAQVVPGRPSESDALSRLAAEMKQGASDTPPASATTPIRPLVPAPRPMTATVPIVSPRVPNNPNPAPASGPNTVQLTIGFEIESLQLTPALKLDAVQIRPTSNVVSVQLDATSQATLQRLLGGGAAPGSAPAFEIESLQLTSAGKIALITLAPKK